MHLFRLHVRPSGGAASISRTFAHCIEEEVLGVGWRTASHTNTTVWDVYYKEAVAIHKNVNTCKYIMTWVAPGDLVWTRDHVGSYYLARVLSGWEYFTTQSSLSDDVDIANVFRVEFKQIDIDAVPGKVVASFRPAKTIQKIADPTTIEYSKYLWNVRSGNQVYDIDTQIASQPDIFSLLDSEEVEDVVFLFLQSEGWLVVPSSRKADTMSFEYLVIHRRSGETAQVQVKTGHSSLDRNAYKTLPFQVILFQSSGLYYGEDQSNVMCLKRTDVEKFLNASAGRLPARLRLKLSMFNQHLNAISED